MSLEEISEASMSQIQPNAPPQNIAPPSASRWWETFWIPLLLAMVISAGAAALVMWRMMPANEIEQRELKAKLNALETKTLTQEQQLQQLDKAILMQGGEVRSNRDQIEALRKSLEKIESYYGATLREIQAINITLAEVRGGLQKEGKMPMPSEVQKR